MTKFMSLLICASVALVVAADAAATVVMDQCTCTCPSKTTVPDVTTGAGASASKMVNVRRRRQAAAAAAGGGDDYDFQNTEDMSENTSKTDETGDTTLGSNNGGNENYEAGEGSIDGNNNIISRASYGHTGRKVGKMKAKGNIKFGR